MARALLFVFFSLLCIQRSSGYDLNHVDNVLTRHRRQTNDIVENFLNLMDDPSRGLIIMADHSKYVTRKIFYTEVTELIFNLLRYHVQNKVAILTFSELISDIHNGFTDTSIQNKCQFFEGDKAIWATVKYNVTDEASNTEPNFKKAFVKAREVSYSHNSNPVAILLITAGDSGADTQSNVWLKSPTWPPNIPVFLATTSNANDIEAIKSFSQQRFAEISNWISALKNHQGSKVDLNLEKFPGGDTTCSDPGTEKFCNPYTGSSICTSCQSTALQPLVLEPSTTTQRMFERLTVNCRVEPCESSSCQNGQCLSPQGFSVCYCNQGFTGTNCQESICKACEKHSDSSNCSNQCLYQPAPAARKSTIPPFALIIPCAVGGFIIILVTILLICVCCKKKKNGGGGGGGGGGTTKKKKTPPPPPDPSLKPVGLVVPLSRPQRVRDFTPEEDNLYAHYGKIPRHQNMPEWLSYIEEMVTIGHMEAAAIVKYDTSEWVCSERAFKVNQKEYDVLCRLLDKRMPNYKVKFKRKEYFLTENDGETLVMESFNPRGEILIVLARTARFLIAVKAKRETGLESAKNEVLWVKESINQQEY